MQEKAGGRSEAAQAGYGVSTALLTAFGITVSGMLILAGILTFTDFPEKYSTVAVLLATLTGLFVSGYKLGIRNERNGIVKGAFTGFVYILILYLVGSILFKDFMLNPRSVIMTLSGILSGAIGGVIGTNRRAKPVSRYHQIGKTMNLFQKYRK